MKTALLLKTGAGAEAPARKLAESFAVYYYAPTIIQIGRAHL